MHDIHEGDAAYGTLNRADQRFAALPDQHLLVIDVLDVSDPHVLLTYAPDALLAAYGPFDGERRARDYLTAAPIARRAVAFSRTVALHHPDQPFLSDDQWLPVPAPWRGTPARTPPTRVSRCWCCSTDTIACSPL